MSAPNRVPARRIPWRLLPIAIAVAIIVLAWLTPEQRDNDWAAPAPQAPLPDLLAALSSREKEEQIAALSEVVMQGTTAIRPVLEAIEAPPDDDLDPLFDVMEELMASSDPAVVDAAEDGLERLSQNGRPRVRRKAGSMLTAFAGLRHSRALNALSELGLDLSHLDETDSTRAAEMAPFVVLDQTWKGGAAGLKHFARLDQLYYIYVDDNVPLSPDELEQFVQGANRRRIRTRRTGCLGVTGRRRVDGFYVMSVLSNSPAERAGLHGGDLVRSFDHRSETHFEDMMARGSATTRPGSTSTLVFERRNVLRSVTIELGTDFGTGRCRCFEGEKAVTQADLRPIPADDAQ